MVIVVAVMPGADAVRGAVELLLAPAAPPEAGLEAEPGAGLVLELELHAATASAAVATTAMAGPRSRWDLFIECLLSRGVPGGRPRGSAGHRAGRPAARRPRARPPARTPAAGRGQWRSRNGAAATALRPGFPAGR